MMQQEHIHSPDACKVALKDLGYTVSSDAAMWLHKHCMNERGSRIRVYSNLDLDERMRLTGCEASLLQTFPGRFQRDICTEEIEEYEAMVQEFPRYDWRMCSYHDFRYRDFAQLKPIQKELVIRQAAADTYRETCDAEANAEARAQEYGYSSSDDAHSDCSADIEVDNMGSDVEHVEIDNDSDQAESMAEPAAEVLAESEDEPSVCPPSPMDDCSSSTVATPINHPEDSDGQSDVEGLEDDEDAIQMRSRTGALGRLERRVALLERKLSLQKARIDSLGFDVVESDVE